MSAIAEKAAAYLPEKPSPGDLKKLEGALVTGATEALAAYALGRSERWLRYVKATYPDIKENVELWKDVADGHVQEASFKSAMMLGKAGVADRIFWLKNRSTKWTDRRVVTGTLEVDWFPRVVQRSQSAEIEEAVRAKMIADGKTPPPRFIDVEAKREAAADVKAKPEAAAK